MPFTEMGKVRVDSERCWCGKGSHNQIRFGKMALEHDQESWSRYDRIQGRD